MIADSVDLQESEASAVYVKRFKSQEVFVKGEYELPYTSGSSKTVIDSRGKPRAGR